MRRVAAGVVVLALLAVGYLLGRAAPPPAPSPAHVLDVGFREAGAQDITAAFTPELVRACRATGGIPVLPFEPGGTGQASHIGQCARPEALTPLWPNPPSLSNP